MATATILAQGTYAAGTYQITAAAIPQGVTRATMSFDRTNWTSPAVKVEATFELSVDGGVTWGPTPALWNRVGAWLWGMFPVKFWGNGDAKGGVMALNSAAIPDPTNPNRQVRGTVVVTGGSVTTNGTITTS